jgi:serine/threonine protein phosphatase PrpC
MMLWSSQALLASHGAGQDRLHVQRVGDSWLLAIADGAGGLSGGAEAADLAIASVRALAERMQTVGPVDLLAALDRADRAIAQSATAGESTLVVVEVRDGRVVGASVGDSEAWVVAGTTVTDLTKAQIRKPLLGSGSAVPTPFGPLACDGRLVIGSDGLFKFCPYTLLVEKLTHSPLNESAAELAESVKLPSGGLQDDVAVIVLGA